MATVWVSRHNCYHYVTGGITDFTLWFSKPVYRPHMFICSTLGPLAVEDYEYGQWTSKSHQGIPVKLLEHIAPALFNQINHDTKQCMIETPNNTCHYRYIESVFKHALHDLEDVSDPIEDNTELGYARHSERNHEMLILAEKSIEKPDMSWREHLLTYDVELNILSTK